MASPLTVNEQVVSLPVHGPDQLVNVEPGSAAAVSVTVVPSATLAVHVVPARDAADAGRDRAAAAVAALHGDRAQPGRGIGGRLGVEGGVPAPPATSSAFRSVERSVLLTRDGDGALHVVENVCAHRGIAFCRERHGNRKTLIFHE